MKLHNRIQLRMKKRFCMLHDCPRGKESNQCDGGFSLLETLVAIVVFSTVITSIGASLVMSHRINSRSELLMQEQLKVSRAVEGIMALGIKMTETTEELTALQSEFETLCDNEYDVNLILNWGNISAEDEAPESTKAFYDVVIYSKVTGLAEDVRVHTNIRAVEGGGE